MTEADLASLRSAWAAVPAERAPGCAPADEIWMAVAGELPEEWVRTLLAHSLGCAECSALWRLAHDLVAASGAPEAAPASARVIPFRSRRAWLAGAGLLAAAALATFALLPRTGGRHEGPVVRGPEEDGLRADPSTRTLDRAHPVLRWSGGPDGARYVVTVSSPDLTVLYRSGTLTVPEAELPPESLSKVAPGTDVVWRVEATLPGGRRMNSVAFLSRVE